MDVMDPSLVVALGARGAGRGPKGGKLLELGIFTRPKAWTSETRLFYARPRHPPLLPNARATESNRERRVEGQAKLIFDIPRKLSFLSSHNPTSQIFTYTCMSCNNRKIKITTKS